MSPKFQNIFLSIFWSIHWPPIGYIDRTLKPVLNIYRIPARDPYICVSKLYHLWFRLWLVAWSLPSHCLNQYWNIVNWTLRNKLQLILDKAILSWPQCVNHACMSILPITYDAVIGHVLATSVTSNRVIIIGTVNDSQKHGSRGGRRAKQPEVGTDMPWRLPAHCWLHCIFGHIRHF